MIIPRGTEIRVNAQGQLSIRTPGNLVIQNSGNFAEIESTNGSIRIDENVTVEAVSIRAGQGCFIQGTLTAWRVHAKRITLEERARAFIMLQESEQLDLAKTARLVGNFANEKELFLMMGKFTGQLKELPGAVNMASPSALDGTATHTVAAIPPSQPYTQTQPIAAQTEPPSTTPPPQATPPTELLRQAQILIERELTRQDLPQRDGDALREILYALRERDVSRIGIIYRAVFAEIANPTDSLRQAGAYLEQFFGR
jgi:hypothetical protein